MEDWQTLVKERQFNDLLIEWNKKINLVSRKKTDVTGLIDDSKLFSEVIDFKEGLNVLDLGTGGGLPGIALAINHTEARFTLVDSIRKKINVVNDIIKKLGLTNAEAICMRAEELHKIPGHKNRYDYIVARSVAVLQDLAKWSQHLLKPSGGKLIAVKGGNIKGEIKATQRLRYVQGIDVVSKNERSIITVKFR